MFLPWFHIYDDKYTHIPLCFFFCFANLSVLLLLLLAVVAASAPSIYLFCCRGLCPLLIIVLCHQEAVVEIPSAAPVEVGGEGCVQRRQAIQFNRSIQFIQSQRHSRCTSVSLSPLVSCPTCDSRHEQDDSKGASQRYERDMSVARLGVAVFGRGGVERVAVAWCHAGFDAEGDWVFVYKTDHATQAQRSRYL